MRGAGGRRSPSSTSAMHASTIASRVRRARAVRPSITMGGSVRSRVMGLLRMSDDLLAGRASIVDHHPFRTSNELEEVADGVAFVDSFANVTALRTDDGLCLVDTGSVFAANAVHTAVRGWTDTPARAAVYTHGHVDHVFGTAAFEAEGPLTVYGHSAVDARFDRYVKTAGYNGVINQRQFRVPGLQWPTEYRRCDVAYDDRHDLEVGGLAIE